MTWYKNSGLNTKDWYYLIKTENEVFPAPKKQAQPQPQQKKQTKKTTIKNKTESSKTKTKQATRPCKAKKKNKPKTKKSKKIKSITEKNAALMGKRGVKFAALRLYLSLLPHL